MTNEKTLVYVIRRDCGGGEAGHTSQASKVWSAVGKHLDIVVYFVRVLTKHPHSLKMYTVDIQKLKEELYND